MIARRGCSQRQARASQAAVLRAVVVALLVGLLGWLGVAAIAAHQLTTPQRVFHPARTPALVGIPYQEVRFPARSDGTMLAGWFLPHATSQRALVLVHGKDGSRSFEVNDKYPKLELAAALHRAGFALLMLDLRGHGHSGDGRFGFGLAEQGDVLGAVDWLGQHGFAPGQIGVLGASLGGAAAIGAAAAEPAIGAVATDASFAEFAPLVERDWERASGLPHFFCRQPVGWPTR
jgi:uncharacterized protein